MRIECFLAYLKTILIGFKSPTVNVYTLAGTVIVVFGLGLKVFQIWSSSVTVDADSSIIGLMGLHIMKLKELPIFYYGQSYMGSLEAIVAAVYFKILGVSASSLHLVPTTFWALFVIANFFLIKKVFGKSTAVVASLFLAFPNAYLSDRLFRAWGGYMETLFFGTLIILITLKIIGELERGGNRSSFWFGLLGFLSGIALWTHFIAIYYLVTAGFLFLISSSVTKIRMRSVVLFSVLFLLGLFPVLLYNFFPVESSDILHFPLVSDKKFQTWEFLFNYGQPLRVRLVWILDNLVRLVSVSLPLLIGTQFNPGFYLLPGFSKFLTVLYFLAGLWLIFVSDKVLRSLLAFKHLEKTTLYKFYPVALGLVTVFGYISGKFALSFNDPRYVVPLYSVLPILVASFLVWVLNKNVVLFLFGFALVLVNHLYPAYGSHLDVDVFKKIPSKENILIEKLKEIKADRIYAGYLVGYPVTFLTSESVIASARYGPLTLERYPLYGEIVDKSQNPVYIFPLGDEGRCCNARIKKAFSDLGAKYKVITTMDFNIYYDISSDVRSAL